MIAKRADVNTKNVNATASQKAYSQHESEMPPDEITDDVSPEYLESLKE